LLPSKKSKKLRAKITTRAETSPGKQMQHVWNEWTLPINDTPIKIYFHQLIFSYSQKKFYTFSTRITASSCLKTLYYGFLFFHGIPKELVIDNCTQFYVIQVKNEVIYFTDDFLSFWGVFSKGSK
jgi:transposase